MYLRDIVWSKRSQDYHISLRLNLAQVLFYDFYTSKAALNSQKIAAKMCLFLCNVLYILQVRNFFLYIQNIFVSLTNSWMFKKG